MTTAILGVIGVAVGAFLTQHLTASSLRRKERLEAIVTLAAACARVIGAHERLYELFADGRSPSPDSELAHGALLERTEAHAQRRTAEARVEILLPEETALKEAVDAFGSGRAAATLWVLEYQRLGEGFSLRDHGAAQEEAWLAMRNARYDLIKAGQATSLRDASRLSFFFGKRIRRVYTGLQAPKDETIASSS